MRRTSTRFMTLVLAFTLAGAALGQGTPSDVLRRAEGAPRSRPGAPPASGVPHRPTARWLGQDGHDVVGPNSGLGPSEVQDIHVAVTGLPPGRVVAGGSLKGLGGSEWVINGPHGPWKAELVRGPGAMTADLYVEPDRVETGRPFSLGLILDDGSTLNLPVKGGKADPNRRMPGKELQASWAPQGSQDLAGPGPSVGPDGLQDARIVIKNLSTQIGASAIAIDGPGLPGWRYGVNPERKANAELLRSEKLSGAAELLFQPAVDLTGKTLTCTVTYANGKTDRATLKAGRFVPGRAISHPPVADLPQLPIKVRWLGQKEGIVVGEYDVHLLLEDLPPGRPIAAVALTDGGRGAWSARIDDRVPFEPESYSTPLALKTRPDGRSADLYFPPDRDESGKPMTLRIVFADRRSGLVEFTGGPCDPGLRAGARPASTSIVARPGQDLNALAATHGTITLAKGIHELDRPLVLSVPVHLKGEPGAVLRFRQRPDDTPWTAAIKIHAGHTTLEGFSVRFAGPVRWNAGVNYGPAVVGITDNLDNGHNAFRADVNLLSLDVEGPPASGPGPWEDAVGTFRLVGAPNGRVENCMIKGGLSELTHGPWKIVGNVHRGARPGTSSQAVFSLHHPHDVVLERNRTFADGPSGKTWRFLVMTGSGFGDRIEANDVRDVGPRDGDTIPNANAPEIMLTEAYAVLFEGKPAAVSPGREIVKIPLLYAEPARTCDVVTILSGPEAGGWRRIVQAIDRLTYLLDAPLPPGEPVISIASGFVDETFRRNRIDARGGSVAVNLVLAGNHYGTRVVENHFLGAGESFRLTSAPTERPCHWGWTHAPFVGGRIEGNTLEDSLRGALLAVEHDAATKSNAGRVYFSGTVARNTAIWTDAFLKAHPREKPAEIAGLVFGQRTSTDPGEMIVATSDNRSVGLPGASILVESARVDGKPLRAHAIPLPPASAGTGTAGGARAPGRATR